MRFENYHFSSEIKKSLEKLGFVRPTDIQYKAIPSIMKGEDVLAIAQTGTGKTAAFAIPLLNMLHNRKKLYRPEGIKCIIMVPTRELAIQITEVFKQIGKHTRVKTVCIYGGVDQEPQIESLQKGADILVATPGRMFDLVNQQHIYLDRIDTLVVDEADLMLDLGFIKDIQDLIKYLPKKRQTLFFSATINKEIKDLAYSLVTNPIRIQISPNDPVSKNVDHAVAYIDMDDKRFFLERMLKENPESKILVFVRTKVRAERVYKAMERVGIKTQTIHGDKAQEDRLSIMKNFKSGATKVLIATDLSARGIDIPGVEYVINYDLPDQAESYVHRIGRTGRGRSRGKALSFCSQQEQEILTEIEKFIGKDINIAEITHADYNDTVSFSEDSSADWKTLMKDFDEAPKFKKKKKK
ncbi:MAG: DEAD/DEAH box helicase [Bacteroidales bacterium]|nr:DEAD/DEAH box helicase [Bacteroidales bacterium]